MPSYNVQMIGTAKEAKRFTAPNHMIYEIHGIFGTCRNAGNNDVYVLTRYVEEGSEALATFEGDDIIYHFVCSTVSNYNVNFNFEPIRTKHLTILQRSTVAIEAQLIILYKLVKASDAELVWEFISRGKNP